MIQLLIDNITGNGCRTGPYLMPAMCTGHISILNSQLLFKHLPFNLLVSMFKELVLPCIFLHFYSRQLGEYYILVSVYRCVYVCVWVGICVPGPQHEISYDAFQSYNTSELG